MKKKKSLFNGMYVIEAEQPAVTSPTAQTQPSQQTVSQPGNNPPEKNIDSTATKIMDANKKMNEIAKSEIKSSQEAQKVVQNADVDILNLFAKEIGADPRDLEKQINGSYVNTALDKKIALVKAGKEVLNEDSHIYEDMQLENTSADKVLYVMIAYYKNQPNQILYKQVAKNVYISLFFSFTPQLDICYSPLAEPIANDMYGITSLKADKSITALNLYILYLDTEYFDFLANYFKNHEMSDDYTEIKSITNLTLDSIYKLNFSSVCISSFVAALFEVVGKPLPINKKAYLVFMGTSVDYDGFASKQLVNSLLYNNIPISNSINYLSNTKLISY